MNLRHAPDKFMCVCVNGLMMCSQEFARCKDRFWNISYTGDMIAENKEH
jgi:hypothetical protein